MNQTTEQGPGVPAADYESDFVAWVERQAALLREGQFSKLDRENLLEELESMGSNEHHELRSRLIVLLVHLLKCKYQPQRKCRSWCRPLASSATRLPSDLSAARVFDLMLIATLTLHIVRQSSVRHWKPDCAVFIDSKALKAVKWRS